METKLLVWNPKFLPKIFGLNNTGALCYLNSLTQALLSCTNIHETLSHCELGRNGKLLAQHYQKLANNEHTITSGSYPMDTTEPIFNAIRTFCHSRPDSIMPGRHEDVHEGLVFLLDTLNSAEVNDQLYVGHMCSITCTVCKASRELPRETSKREIAVDLSSMVELHTRKEVVNAIREDAQYPRDYVCEHCRATNTYNAELKTVVPNVKQTYKLVRLSSVIILVFKKYNGAHEWNTPKRNSYFPKKMRFRSKHNTTLVYKVVAQIEHFGDMHGGHYICHALRPKPEGYHDKRAKLLEEKFMSAGDTAGYKKYMEENDRMRAKPYGVFTMNDTNVSFKPEGFEPSNNTYVVFYQLWRIR